MASKKEKLKFYRLITRPSYSSAAYPETPPISGYINYWNEFKKWDIELEANFTSLPEDYLGPGPFKVFDEIENYKNLSFLIDGVHEPYDRRKHNLDDFYSRIYVVLPSDEGPIGIHIDEIKKEDINIYGRPISKPVENNPTLTFYINPTHIRVLKRKLFQQIRTRGGWAFQHWGPQIGEINLEGTTGNITPNPKISWNTYKGIPYLPYVVDEAPTESNSPALKAFRQLETWYDEDQSEIAQKNGYLLALEYRDHIYVGHIREFSYEERGERPFQLYYRLVFLIHYDASSLAAVTSRAAGQIIRNESTLKYIRDLKRASTERETKGTR